MKLLISLILLSCFSTIAISEMHKEEVLYKQGDTHLSGMLFWDDKYNGKRPAVMVFHEWWGLNDYALLRAEMFAESGYVAFAADMYGDDKRTRHADDAKGWMKQVTDNVDVWQQRAELSLTELLSHKKVDITKTAAIGYSFGGATAMQLAYTGSKINGVISVHGSLPVATKMQASKINANILVLHGASDTFIPKDHIDKFSTVLNEQNVNWEMNIYGGAKHSFSNPYADGYGIDGVEFNETAEQLSWARTLSFLEQLFANLNIKDYDWN